MVSADLPALGRGRQSPRLVLMSAMASPCMALCISGPGGESQVMLSLVWLKLYLEALLLRLFNALRASLSWSLMLRERPARTYMGLISSLLVLPSREWLVIWKVQGPGEVPAYICPLLGTQLSTLVTYTWPVFPTLPTLLTTYYNFTNNFSLAQAFRQ